MGKTMDYQIRNFLEKDAEKIGSINFLSMLYYRFNKDFKPENTYCAVNSEGEIYAFGHVVPDQTWCRIEDSDNDPDFIHKINLELEINEHYAGAEACLEELLQHLLNKAQEMRDSYPNKKVVVSHNIDSDDYKEMDFYLSKGFVVSRNHIIMKRDLTEPIPDAPLPENIRIKNWKMKTEAEEQQYLKAEGEGDGNGVSWSLNHLRWTKSGSEWDTFTAFEGDQVVGSCMTWGLGENRGATENIFVLPDWRRKGVAKAVITEALKFLKDKGKTEATLGVFGENEKAIPLYRSLGYKVIDVKIEFGLSI